MTGERAAAPPRQALVHALRRQVADCRASPLYASVLGVVLDDLAQGGPAATVLAAADPATDPRASAVPLRLLGALHRIVLTGRAPALAAHYPSAGGRFDGTPAASFARDVRAALAEHAGELAAGLARPVQTNEVGRSVALVGGFHRVARSTGRPLRLLELGASAGLNLRFDHYAYDTGEHVAGDPTSSVRFGGVWTGAPPVWSRELTVAERRGCDRHPLDPRTDEGRLTLRSFVWADQPERSARLEAALAVARTVPVVVERAEADAWIEEALATPAVGLATVVFHSSVQPYFSPAAFERVRAAIERAGSAATPDASVHWLRMEEGHPGAPHAEVRLASWAGRPDDGRDELLATAGFHGPPVHGLG